MPWRWAISNNSTIAHSTTSALGSLGCRRLFIVAFINVMDSCEVNRYIHSSDFPTFSLDGLPLSVQNCTPSLISDFGRISLQRWRPCDPPLGFHTHVAILRVLSKPAVPSSGSSTARYGVWKLLRSQNFTHLDFWRIGAGGLRSARVLDAMGQTPCRVEIQSAASSRLNPPRKADRMG